MKSDAQLRREQKEKNPDLTEQTLEEALMNIPDVTLDIARLVSEKYGSYIEIAYEWSWEEAQDILELLDIREEKSTRDELKRRAQGSDA